MNFEEHLKILLFFLLGLVVLFIISFTLEIQKLWLSVFGSIVIIGCIVVILARSKDEIGGTE